MVDAPKKSEIVAPLQPNTDTFVRVTRDELPLHCPRDGRSQWNSHPRVFIPVETTGEAKCGYCGTVYELVTRVKSDNT